MFAASSRLHTIIHHQLTPVSQPVPYIPRYGSWPLNSASLCSSFSLLPRPELVLTMRGPTERAPLAFLVEDLLPTVSAAPTCLQRPQTTPAWTPGGRRVEPCRT